MINYRLANKEDNEQLIGLAAETGMAGNTPLRIERKPDFFKLLDMRGESKVFIATDHSKIIGCICVSHQLVYVDNQIFPLKYIGDFKVAENYRNKGIGLQLCNNLADYLLSVETDLAFLNVSKSNNKPMSFFKNRPEVPDFENIGLFNIYQFVGKKNIKAGIEIELVNAGPDVIDFLNKYYSTYQLGTVINKSHLHDTEIYAIRKDEKIIAIMCLADMMSAKQNVVTKLSWKMKCVLKCINAFSKLTGLSHMPLLNHPVKMVNIKYLAVKNNSKHLVTVLIAHAKHIAFHKKYSFVSIGVHQKDQLNLHFKGMFKMTFNSVGMLLTMKNNTALINKVKSGVPFEDYSLV